MFADISAGIGQLVNNPTHRLVDNLRTTQLADSQVTDWSARGVVDSPIEFLKITEILHHIGKISLTVILTNISNIDSVQ